MTLYQCLVNVLLKLRVLYSPIRIPIVEHAASFGSATVLNGAFHLSLFYKSGFLLCSGVVHSLFGRVP